MSKYEVMLRKECSSDARSMKNIVKQLSSYYVLFLLLFLLLEVVVAHAE